MVTYVGDAGFDHARAEGTAVLLVNLGTPDAPTAGAVRRYLAEFLSDPRVVELPRWQWLPILHGIILRVRPARSARAYRKVWTAEGSPLLSHGLAQARAVEAEMARLGRPVPVRLAMRYGNPGMAEVLNEFRGQGLARLVVLPLYPQYSGATTGSTFDAVAGELSRWRRVPGLGFIDGYHDNPAYLDAVAESVRAAWASEGRGERLLMSFHGLPQRFLEAGDPYHCQCHATARLVAERLGLGSDDYAVSFQSRVGRDPWLRPYTDELLVGWAREGVAEVDVVCPGFSADCLETLEEIAIGERERFIAEGGTALRYIPALNATPAHVGMLAQLALRTLGEETAAPDFVARAERAGSLGAAH